MITDADACYRALAARDARFDGRFFTAVSSTGVYCRPVCPARTPNRRNCRFFPSASAAEAAGFRPCLRCRPELAPGYATVDATPRLARSAARRIEDGALEVLSLAELASELGVTDRHLRRVFRAELGVAPVAYAQTQRLLLAKRLLTDTGLGVLEVAMASGFGSLRRMNALFRRRYHMAPTALRRRRTPLPIDRLSFELAYRPPYDWDAVLAFLARRAIPGVEATDDGCYRRTLRVGTAAGWIEVRSVARRSALRVLVDPALARAIPAVLSRVKDLFDLSCRPDEVAAVLGPLAERRPGLRLPGAVCGFEVAVRAILGQQITVRAATTVTGRFAAAFGEPLELAPAGLHRFFPRPGDVAALDPGAIAALGIVGTRARAIVELARRLDRRELRLDPSADVEASLAVLESIPGVGPWTAQYIAMRALAWPDAFPHPDVGVLRAMGRPRPRDALARAEAWRPWRAYAVLHLWTSLETAP